MNIQDIQQLYDYNRWANRRVLQMAATLTAEQFLRDLGGSLPSVRDTLLHILSGEWGWLSYWKASSIDSAFLADLRKQREAMFAPTAFPDVAAVQSKWLVVETEQSEFLKQLTNESLEKMLPLRATQVTLAHLMQHLANHSTYHRGQLALMMRQLHAEPIPTDFHLFLLETEAGR